MKPLGVYFRAAAPVASVLLILAGVIQLRAEFWTSGAVCLLLGMAGIVYGLRLMDKSPFTPEEIETLRPFVLPALGWLVVTVLVMVSVLNVADNFLSPQTDRVAAAAWVAAVVLGLALTWRGRPAAGRARELIAKLRERRLELLALVLVLGLALALRTVGLSSHPYPWSGDEASIGSEAARIIQGKVTNLFDTGWSSQPNWSFVPTVITETLLGNNILAIRLASALIGTLAVLFVYLAARELFNPAVGLMAAAFLAALPYHLHFSRIGVYNVVDSLMSSAVFWLLAKAIRTNDHRYYYTAGAVAGLCIYTYVGTRLVLLLGLATVFFLVIRERGFLLSHRRHLIAFLGGSAVSVAPQAAFFARHPDIFMGRFGQEGILLNGWLAAQAAQTGKSVFEVLFNQLTRTVLVFISSPALGNFFNSPRPYLTVLGSLLFLAGMAYSLAGIREVRHFILILWFGSVILFGGILTLNPPANTRMLMTTPVVAIFMGLGTYTLLEYLQKIRLVRGRLFAATILIVVGVVTWQNVYYYMVEYPAKYYFQDPNGEYGMEVGLMTRQLGDGFQIYVLGEPRVFSSFPTLSYLAPRDNFIDLGVAGLASFQLSPAQKAAFFAIPENQAMLAQIRQRFPGGQGGLVFRKSKPGEVLFEYYVLKR
ncbi:MAG: ArnT family glycosyltransferase [Bacteroidota bacterium]